MALSISSWSSSLQSKLNAVGFTGTELPTFCTAVATGSVNHIVGKTFITADVGFTVGTGVGDGVGITGIVTNSISSVVFSTGIGLFGYTGIKMQDLSDVIEATCIEQLALATLTSVDTPVYSGTGTIIIGSIPLISTNMASLIQAAAPSFTGPQWPNLATAIATGQCNAIVASGTGTLVVTGPPPVSPVPGTGSGTGVIS